MDLVEFVRVLKAHRMLIIVCVIVCTVTAALVAWTRSPSYVSSTQLFVSTRNSSADEIYQNGLFSQQRIQSYVQLVTSPPVLTAVIKELELPFTADQLAANVKATVPKDTVLIDVSASDESAPRSRMIAASVARHFATFVTGLESSRSEPSPVKVTVTSPAQLPQAPVSPRKLAYLMIGLTMGLVLGAIAAVLSEVMGASRRSRVPLAPAEGSAFASPLTRQRVPGSTGPVE